VPTFNRYARVGGLTQGEQAYLAYQHSLRERGVSPPRYYAPPSVPS
jgi:hypothetical protein